MMRNLEICVFLFVLMVLSIAAEEVLESENETRPVRGRDAEIIEAHSMPWLVRVNIRRSLCSGSIIGSKWILTAAHCFQGDITGVAVGIHDYKQVGRIGRNVRIDKLFFLTDYNGFKETKKGIPEWNWRQARFDIGLIKLVESVLWRTDIKTSKAKLASPYYSDCKMCTGGCQTSLDAAGWGFDPFDHSSISENLPQHTPKTCKFCTKEEKDPFGVHRDGYKESMCAISSIDPHHHDVCGGDSGGPLMKKGTNVIVGIVQGGKKCAKPDVYRLGRYMDVSTTEVQRSIKKLVPDLLIEQDDCRDDYSWCGQYSSYCFSGYFVNICKKTCQKC